MRDGDDWVVNGHKIWTSQATVAQRCIALLRTGTPESRHRGLVDDPRRSRHAGCDVRPIRAITGRDEFGEVLFDDVHVGGDRLLGNEGDGWAMAMYLLQWERGMYPWQRQAGLLTALDRLLADHADAIDPGELADAYLAILPMRVSSRNTIRRLAAGENPGPEVSVDKVLLARAEVTVHDLADAVLDGRDRVRRRRPDAEGGATTTCSAARRRSTAAPSRSSARSWPTACSGCREADMIALDSDTLDLFARTVRGVFDRTGRRRRSRAQEIGWRDILAADPASVVPLVFRLHGELGLASGALEDVAFASTFVPCPTSNKIAGSKRRDILSDRAEDDTMKRGKNIHAAAIGMCVSSHSPLAPVSRGVPTI